MQFTPTRSSWLSKATVGSFNGVLVMVLIFYAGIASFGVVQTRVPLSRATSRINGSVQFFLNHRVLMRSRRTERVGKTPKGLLTGEADGPGSRALARTAGLPASRDRLTLASKGRFKPFAIRPCKTRDRQLARSVRARLCCPKTVAAEPREIVRLAGALV